jgi:hypothetical protein
VLIHDSAAILIYPTQRHMPIHAHLRETLDRSGRITRKGMMTSPDAHHLARVTNQYAANSLMIRLPNGDEYAISTFDSRITDGRCSVGFDYQATRCP